MIHLYHRANESASNFATNGFGGRSKDHMWDLKREQIVVGYLHVSVFTGSS
jgi:hypothetical protein